MFTIVLLPVLLKCSEKLFNVHNNLATNVRTEFDLFSIIFPVFVYTLVGDYGYDTLQFLTNQRLLPTYIPFTKICIAYWIIVSAILLLNIFIALMSGISHGVNSLINEINYTCSNSVHYRYRSYGSNLKVQGVSVHLK